MDIISELDTIKEKLAGDAYNSSYTAMGDIRAAVVKAHDYHFQLRPTIRSMMRGWKRGEVGEAFAMVSVSKDGKELPRLYDYRKFPCSSSVSK